MGVRSTSRRGFLASVAAGIGGVAGCTGVTTTGTPPQRVSLLAAGSLNNALENGLRPTLDVRLEVEAHGSVEAARLVASGAKDPDIVSVADVALFESPLETEWYAEFATNSVVLAYNPDTPGGQRIAAAGSDRWYRPLSNEAVSLGRTDPDLDPLGYRSLFVLDLASEYYETAVDLRATVPSRDQVYPETQLMAQFETGGIDAALAYRSMAVERGYDYIELPPEIDLSSPRFAERYATVDYELPDGVVVRGGVISYGSTVRHPSPTVNETFEKHVAGPYLEAYGFGVPDDYPRYRGDVPATFAR